MLRGHFHGCWDAGAEGRGQSCAGDDAAASPRSWLYLQICVENPDEGADLGIAGTFQDDESSRSILTPAEEESQEGQAEPGWNSGWDSLWMQHMEPSLAVKARAQWGRSRCWEPGKVCALAPGTRASTAGQLSHRCLGSGGARAAGGAAALPHASCSPREAFLGANKRSQEALCAQDRLGTCHTSPQILPCTI